MRRDWPLFAERTPDVNCSQPQSAATKAWIANMFLGTPLPVALAVCELLRWFEPVEVAHRVNVPTLLLHGDSDKIVPIAVSRDCAARMKSARVEIVPDSGHMIMLDQKERLHQLVGDFARAHQG